MIINIRGTSGSGKTYAVRQLMNKLYPGIWADVYQGGKVIAQLAHFDMQPAYIVGNYGANVCGGCDGITSQNMVCSLVRHFSQFGHVVFEGLILSHLYARYVALDEELTKAGERYVWAFLDTPLDMCLSRVQERRDARGDTRPFNPDNTIGKFESIQKCIEKVRAVDRNVVILDHTKAAEQLQDLLTSNTQFRFDNSYREESFR